MAEARVSEFQEFFHRSSTLMAFTVPVEFYEKLAANKQTRPQQCRCESKMWGISIFKCVKKGWQQKSSAWIFCGVLTEYTNQLHTVTLCIHLIVSYLLCEVSMFSKVHKLFDILFCTLSDNRILQIQILW